MKKTKSTGALDRRHWPESKKLEVLQAFLVMGNLALAARTCNVPEITVRLWKTSVWWKETEFELRRASKLQLGARLHTLIQKSMDVLGDRLENGDYIVTKFGALVRKPVSAEHANKITTQLIDRQLKVDKEAAVEHITEEGLDQRFAKIKADLASLAKKYIPPSSQGEIIDVIPNLTSEPVEQGVHSSPEVQAPDTPTSTPTSSRPYHPLARPTAAGAKLGLDDSTNERITLGRPSAD